MEKEAVSSRNRSPSSDQPGLNALGTSRFFERDSPDSDASAPPAEDALHRVPLDHAFPLKRLAALPACDNVHDPALAHSRLLDLPARPSRLRSSLFRVLDCAMVEGQVHHRLLTNDRGLPGAKGVVTVGHAGQSLAARSIFSSVPRSASRIAACERSGRRD